jgi:hypothetical protein
MPLPSARFVGPLKAVRETSATAMPDAFAVIAALNAFTISLMSDVFDPVHW